MNYADYLNIGQYAADILDSSVIYQAGANFSGDGGTMAPTVGLAMYNSNNLTMTIENIADSMTNAMRTTQSNLTSADGTALVIQTYIHIEWRWLALPILIALLSLILLIVVVIRTHNSGVEGQATYHSLAKYILTMMLTVWKSSSLPLLLHDVQGWNDPGKGPENSELSQVSQNMSSRLLLDRHYRVFQRSNTALSKAPE